MSNSFAVPLILLATSDREVRRRSQNSVLLSAIPGNEGMRGAVSAIAVTQQARQSIADETAAVIAAARLIAAKRTPVATPILQTELNSDPVLQRIAEEEGVLDALNAAVLASESVSSAPSPSAVAASQREPDGKRRSSTQATARVT